MIRESIAVYRIVVIYTETPIFTLLVALPISTWFVCLIRNIVL